MAENRKQHYVPQFYLRYWSNNGKSISGYMIEQLRHVASMAIDGQCQEEYFYGKDLIIEKSFSKLEGIHDLICKRIHVAQTLPNRNTIDGQRFEHMIALQYSRTRQMADTYSDLSQEFFDKIGKKMLDSHMRQNDLYRKNNIDPSTLNNLQLSLENPINNALKSGSTGHYYLWDLN